jgi:hypothetical protein
MDVKYTMVEKHKLNLLKIPPNKGWWAQTQSEDGKAKDVYINTSHTQTHPTHKHMCLSVNKHDCVYNTGGKQVDAKKSEH